MFFSYVAEKSTSPVGGLMQDTLHERTGRPRRPIWRRPFSHGRRAALRLAAATAQVPVFGRRLQKMAVPGWKGGRQRWGGGGAEFSPPQCIAKGQ